MTSKLYGGGRDVGEDQKVKNHNNNKNEHHFGGITMLVQWQCIKLCSSMKNVIFNFRRKLPKLCNGQLENPLPLNLVSQNLRKMWDKNRGNIYKFYCW
jgi:hypothetical protein